MPMVLLISYSGALGGAERHPARFRRGALRASGPRLPGRAAGRGRPRRRRSRVLPLPERSLAAARLRARRALTALADLAGARREARRLIADLDPELVIAWGMRSALACLLGPRSRCPVVFQHNDLLPGPLIARAVRAPPAGLGS